MTVFRIDRCLRLALGFFLSLSSIVGAHSAGAQEQIEATFPPPVIIQSAPPRATLEIAKPVEVKGLGDVDPESIGLLSASDGGLGSALWKGTSREMLEKLLPEFVVPLSSPALNDLVRRFLISTTAVPEGPSSLSQTLPSIKVTKLVMAGDIAEAWKLAQLTKPDLLSEISLRLVIEALLVRPQSNLDICSLLPELMKTHNSPDWQKILVVCQLREKNIKAAQLGLDLLHAQDVKDDVFFQLVEKNIIAGSKVLPKQLAPLNALTLALLQLTGFDFPPDVYTHPEAALIPALLAAPLKDDAARLNLAEQSAAQGIITGADLAAVYKSTTSAAMLVGKNPNPMDRLALSRAVFYQMALQEKNLQDRLNDADKFMHIAPPALLQGAGSNLLVDMVGDCPVVPDSYAVAPMMTTLHLIAGHTALAMEWLKLAKQGAVGLPKVAAEVQNLWPLLVLSGLEPDQNYAVDRERWLDAMVHPLTPSSDTTYQRKQASSLLMLLDAAGYVVADGDWTKVIPSSEDTHPQEAPAWVLEQLAAAAAANHRGEAILLSLIAGKTSVDPSSHTLLAIIHALRHIGLVGDASALAREAAIHILFSHPDVP